MRAKQDVDKLPLCAACGATASRVNSKFCPVCGKLLSEEYCPLDTIRSAHGLQRISLRTLSRGDKTTDLFESKGSFVSRTAWAFVVYSMLPYLGILFVPFAFASGGITYFRSLSTLDADGQRIAKTCIGLSSLLLSIQPLLWLLLYIIPESGINI